jgi:hypothetical protein
MTLYFTEVTPETKMISEKAIDIKHFDIWKMPNILAITNNVYIPSMRGSMFGIPTSGQSIWIEEDSKAVHYTITDFAKAFPEWSAAFLTAIDAFDPETVAISAEHLCGNTDDGENAEYQVMFTAHGVATYLCNTETTMDTYLYEIQNGCETQEDAENVGDDTLRPASLLVLFTPSDASGHKTLANAYDNTQVFDVWKKVMTTFDSSVVTHITWTLPT